MDSSSLAYVMYVGDETRTHIITAMGDNSNLGWELGQSKWVNYGDFLKAFASREGVVPDYFTVLNILYPDTP